MSKRLLLVLFYPAKKVDLYYTHRDLEAHSLVEVGSQLCESKFYGQATKGRTVDALAGNRR